MKDPVYIQFEGPDGSSKSTTIKNLQKIWKDNYNSDLVKYIDPGISLREEHKKWQDIRNFVKYQDMDSLTETCMFFALRSELMSNIEKELKKGNSVACDRGNISTWVYQGYCKNQSEFIEDFEKIVQFKQPDYTFILMADFDVLSDRLEKRAENIDKFKSNEDFRRKVYKGYWQFIQKNKKDNIYIIEANGTEEEVLNDCLKILLKNDR